MSSKKPIPSSLSASASPSTEDDPFAPAIDRLIQLANEQLASGAPHAWLARFAPYADDPVAFCREQLGVRLWNGQEAILKALVTDSQIAVKSAHGVGKSFLAACATLWFCYCHRPSLVVTTAPSARQVERILWAEIRRRWARAPVPLLGRCLATRLEASPEQQALGFTASEPEKAAGLHAPHLLAIVDEASGVPDPLFETLHGALTSAHCRLLLIGNPTRLSGQFHRCFHTEGWRRFTLSAYDSPNFEGVGRSALDVGTESERPMPNAQHRAPYPYPGLVTPEWAEERRREWGEGSNAFRVRVLGEFPHRGADTLIERAWLEAAHGSRLTVHGSRCTVHGSGKDGPDGEPCTVHCEPCTVSREPCTVSREPITLGVDVARFGDCETVAAVREGERLVGMEAWQGEDLMATVGRLARLIERWRPGVVVVDAVGMGAGVVDRLRELAGAPTPERLPGFAGLGIVAFQSGERAVEAGRFRHRRDEAYWGLRERYQEGRIGHAGSFPKLVGQLAELRYRFSSSGQTVVESKEELRQRGLPSPDWADAVALAFAPLPRPARRPALLGSVRRG